MLAPSLLLSLLIAGQESALEPAHKANPVFSAILQDGLRLGEPLRPPSPRFDDEQTADEQRAEVVKIAGSERGAAEFLRDSVTAPIILKLKDTPGQSAVGRQGSLWFSVHADFDSINPDALGLESRDSRPVEAGNMRFTSRMLEAPELKSFGIETAAAADGPREWYVRLSGRLLDRIHVEETEHIAATRSERSWVVAAVTDRRFENVRKGANRWWPILRQGSKEEPGPTHPYEGGVSYVKISKLAGQPGVLVAEAQFVFAEPRPWFDGAPILRSKIGVIAQDQVRQLRRELAKRKSRGDAPKPGG